MTSLTCMKNFKSLVFVIHSQLMKEKYIAPTGDRTRVLGLTGEDSTTEPTGLQGIQVCESYLNIINYKFCTLKLICLCYIWFYYQPIIKVIFLFISHGLKFMRKEISFFLRGRMARGAALSKKKFPFSWALAHEKWNFVHLFSLACACVLKSCGEAEIRFVHKNGHSLHCENGSNDFS